MGWMTRATVFGRENLEIPKSLVPSPKGLHKVDRIAHSRRELRDFRGALASPLRPSCEDRELQGFRVEALSPWKRGIDESRVHSDREPAECNSQVIQGGSNIVEIHTEQSRESLKMVPLGPLRD